MDFASWFRLEEKGTRDVQMIHFVGLREEEG